MIWMRSCLLVCAFSILVDAGATKCCAQTFPTGYCTNFAAQQFNNRVAPYGLKVDWSGNAGAWADNAKAKGWIIETLPTKAEIGCIIVWKGGSGGFGHVAIVRNVWPGGLSIEEMNWGEVVDAGSAKTVNFGKVTRTFLSWDELKKRSKYVFAGYVQPRKW